MSGTLARITSQRQAIEAVLQPGAASCCMVTPLGVVSPAERRLGCRPALSLWLGKSDSVFRSTYATGPA